jgi:PilZ domain
MENHRIAPRQRVLKAGTIEFSGSKVDCLIRNVSATGAALEVNSPLWFPDVFVLVMTADGSSRRCHIVWRNGKRIGVTFDDQVDT